MFLEISNILNRGERDNEKQQQGESLKDKSTSLCLNWPYWWNGIIEYINYGTTTELNFLKYKKKQKIEVGELLDWDHQTHKILLEVLLHFKKTLLIDNYMVYQLN